MSGATHESPRILLARCQVSSIHTLLDAPCGDFNWIRHFDLPVERYIGVDIVPELVLANRAKALSRQQRFMIADIVCDPLPRADLTLFRDALIHLSIDEIFATLHHFRLSRPAVTIAVVDHLPSTRSARLAPSDLTRRGRPRQNKNPPRSVAQQSSIGRASMA
jgi:hypothetical protein